MTRKKAARKRPPSKKLPAGERWTKGDEERTHAMLIMLGANEAVKEPDIPLGTKVFYRMIRDDAYERFLEAGGKIDNVTSPPTLVLKTRPELKFYVTDIEAMRQLVAEHDARRS